MKVSSGKNLMACVFAEMFQDKWECGKELRINNYTTISLVFLALII